MAKTGMIFLLAPILAGALGPAQALFAQDEPCTEPSAECVAALQKHVVKSDAYWADALARPVLQRIGPAPDEVLDFITRDNIMRGYPNRPRTAELSPEFLHDVELALSELPASVLRRLEKKLAGIYFAVDFGGTGITDAAAGKDGQEDIGFTVLDSTVLGARTANAWATWKENTPFWPEAGYKLVAQIEDESNDNRRNAIQFILLHELGHVLAIGENIHPPWSVRMQDVEDTEKLKFFSLSWLPPNGADRYASRFDDRFPERKDVVYYFGAKLSREKAATVYEDLEKTNFPSLYAATHPADDWAESFAGYVHSVLLGKPFEIRIWRGKKLIKTYGSCWEEPRCAEKRKFIEHFLQAE